MGRWDQQVDYRRGRSQVSMLHVHLVFVTKYRSGVLTPIHLDTFKEVAAKVCDDFNSVLVECDGEDDHVHLLVEYPPTVQLSKLVNSLKGVTSRVLRRDHPDIRTHNNHLWSPSYFAASCGGAPLTVIADYVANQRQPSPATPEG